MSAISGVTSQALQYAQINAQPKTTPVAPAQAVQATTSTAVKDSDGDQDGSIGNNINTYA